MAPAANNTSTFHHFMSLALELREQIWRDALPDDFERALYFYKRGGWRPRQLLPSDDRYNAHDSNDNTACEYRHDILDVIHIEIPLFFVNHEAYNIALAWIRDHDLEIRAYRRASLLLQPPVFIRSFDPKHDTLYVSLDQWDQFISEPDILPDQPEFLERRFWINAAPIKRLALPVELFRLRGVSTVAVQLAELIFCYFDFLEDLFIIVDAPLDLQATNNDMKVQHRWVLKNGKGGAFFWNHNHRRFDFIQTEDVINDALYKLMEEIHKVLVEDIATKGINILAVRPVFAVRK